MPFTVYGRAEEVENVDGSFTLPKGIVGVTLLRMLYGLHYPEINQEDNSQTERTEIKTNISDHGSCSGTVLHGELDPVSVRQRPLPAVSLLPQWE
ncbi:hypothetical protein JOB18_004636 [Solea senegalensis]|uniref:Uncharacterized protein n=1 Tax=Solea senegalensis TaxID=28829 RepID=A0AAV6RRV8_SOLSE|nr:hypothetical protein JOB18_004636 [Solea senegalensis]